MTLFLFTNEAVGINEDIEYVLIERGFFFFDLGEDMACDWGNI